MAIHTTYYQSRNNHTPWFNYRVREQRTLFNNLLIVVCHDSKTSIFQKRFALFENIAYNYFPVRILIAELFYGIIPSIILTNAHGKNTLIIWKYRGTFNVFPLCFIITRTIYIINITK